MSRALPTVVQAVIDFRGGSIPTNEEDDQQLEDARQEAMRAVRFYHPKQGQTFRDYVYEHATKGLENGAKERGTDPTQIMPHPVDQSPESSPPIAGPRSHQNRPEGQAL